MAESAQRQGAPGHGVRAAGGPAPDNLHAAQRAVLAPAPSVAAGEPTVTSARPTIRRFNGDKRTERVGPLRFLTDERVRLHQAAAEHGYSGASGFAADVVLAFLDGRFTANLPLSEDRRRTHHFRAQVLRQLNRIGVNINQIARALNSDATPPEIRERLDELHLLLTHIARALREPADHPTES
ncbi:MobC family plasmid mobilization relaxosome protein [Streptomyces sp. NPDC059740]|uniref:MobC family plasmid mobilization relaxosome protein n=1 Tax=Streptomyces sp. NPDC059740 TaxID=3346926 RepID=UPI003659BB27